MLTQVAIAVEAHAQEFKHGRWGRSMPGSRTTVHMRSTSQLSGHAIATPSKRESKTLIAGLGRASSPGSANGPVCHKEADP